MRSRFNFKLKKDDFISAMGGIGTAGVWHQCCGSGGKTAFISERKPISVSFSVRDKQKDFHDHAKCLRCAIEISAADRPCDCNTEVKNMKASCSLKIKIPWGTGVTSFREPIYDPSGMLSK